MTVLEITVQRRGEAGYPVVAELTVSGQMPTRAEGLLQIDRVDLLALLDPLSYGTLLGQGVLSRGVRDAFVRARAGGETVHVLLFVEAPELRDLRWERLCAPLDDDRWDFLARDPRVPLSIHLPTATDRRFPPCGRADMRALVLVASPPGLERFGFSPFDAAGALRSVRAGLGDIPHDCLCTDPGAVGPPTLRALIERLVGGRYTMLHLVCHGLFKKDDGETAILIAGDDGRAEPVAAERLLAGLRGIGGSRGLPRFVFLATCESADPRAEGALGGLAHRLVRDLGVPAVIAMTEKVSQTTALALGTAFYPRLREHGEVDRALVEALALIGERFDAAVPAVFSRLAGRPLFTDDPGRAPTPTELQRALDVFTGLLPVRAPALVPRVEALARQLRPLIEVDDESLAAAARRERAELLEQFDALCEEVADVPATALALGKSPPAYDATCPFPGLQAFRGDESRFFFGRDALIDRLDRELQGAPFLAVLGQSGSGKSSAVLAGLVPRLARARPGLGVVTIVPGAEPLARLSQALEGAGLAPALARASQPRRRKGRTTDATPPAVLVVDQLEEAFTLCADADRRSQFFAQLLALSDDLLVVVTLRADFLGEVAPHVDLRTAIERHQVIVAPMTPSEMRAAIEQQAAAVGLRFDGDLMATILADVQAEPGAMPLLQHALLELWRRRHGRWLRADEYRALGGVSRAIAETADAIFRELDDDDQARVRRIFTRLTRVDVDAAPGGERRDTRRRLALAELVPAGEDPEPTSRLIARLAGDRLLVTAIHPQTGHQTVEVSHEALIRRWPRLQTWLGEDLEGMRKIHQLGEAAVAWSEAGRAADLIAHRGVRLAEVQELAASGRFPLNQREAEYLAACVETADRLRREEEEARARELEQARAVADAQRQRAEAQESAARAIQRRARIIAVIGALAVVTAIASVVLYRQAEQALAESAESRKAAEQAQKQAEAGEAHAHDALLVSTVDRLDGDATRQALVLREVATLGDDPRWHEPLIRIASESRAIGGFDTTDPIVYGRSEGGGLALDATGERLLSLARSGEATLRRVAGPTPLWTVPLPEERARGLRPVAGGALVVGLEANEFVRLDETITPARDPPSIALPAGEVFDIDASAGRLRVLVGPDLDSRPVCDLLLVELDADGWTADTRCVLADLRMERGDRFGALLLPVADAALVLGRDGRATLHPLSGGPAIGALATALTGESIASEWSGGAWVPGIMHAARNESGSRVVLAGARGVEAWAIEADGQARQLGKLAPPTINSDLWAVAVDGETPVVVDARGAVRMLEGKEWPIVASFVEPTRRTFSPPLVHDTRARLLATAVGSTVQVLELGPRRLRVFEGHASEVRNLALSLDGRRLASADAEAVRVWDLRAPDGARTWTSDRSLSSNRSLSIEDVAPDGRHIAVREMAEWGRFGSLKVLSLAEPEPPRTIAEGVLAARFLADGATLAIRSESDEHAFDIELAAPGSVSKAVPPDREWRVDTVFADPARTFVDDGVLWGILADGRAWASRPPGREIQRVEFSPDGARALLIYRHDDQYSQYDDRAALLSRSGELTELFDRPPLTSGGRVSALGLSPDGARLFAVQLAADGACAFVWPPEDPASARRTCVTAAEVPGGAKALAESQGGLAWSPDGSLVAVTLGDGNLLVAARGDSPPRWLDSRSRASGYLRTLRFSAAGDLLIQTSLGIHAWPIGSGEDTPLTLLEFAENEGPGDLRGVPIDGGMITVHTGAGASLTARRWQLDLARAEAALTTGSPFCLEPPWRRSYLHESEADARQRYGQCRASLAAPDPACAQ